MNMSFTLTGKKFFPLYIAFYALFVFYMIGVYSYTLSAYEIGQSSSVPVLFFVSLIVFFLGILLLYTPMLRLFINNLCLDGQAFRYGGRVMPFFWKNLLGIFLSIVTIGIYTPWYTKNIYAYIVDHIEYNGQTASFMGKGSKLLGIMLLTLVLPIVVVSLISILVISSRNTVSPQSNPLTQIIMYILLVPYMFYMLKWSVDFVFGTLKISLDAAPGAAMGKIFGQVLLSIITLGIYTPAAYARLFRYFAGTISVENRENGVFGHPVSSNISIKRAFLLSWGQSLLTIITLGLYGPWALVRISRLYWESVTVQRLE